MPTPSLFRFDNSYAHLPELFYARQNPTPVASPSLVCLNEPLAAELGIPLSATHRDMLTSICAGNMIPEGAEPLAQAYAGHQFGHFTKLGDGRAILLGEHLTPDGKRIDIQLKGSGKTPFSRRGDGRAALGPMLREYLISEAMHGLGIPTTRSLAVVTTGEPVFRETALPGAILMRVASSHIRVGTFEYVAETGDLSALKILTDYTLKRHFPHLLEAENPALALFQAVVQKQASLLAQWMLIGFIHGVMNTDNMALSGETIDYGPCAFMDRYDPETVFSSIDRQGRYAYGNQPHIAQWNLARLGECLLPLIDANPQQAITLVQESLHRFAAQFGEVWMAVMRAKLGLFTPEHDDANLMESLLQWMVENEADYTNIFRSLMQDISGEPSQQDRAYIEWHQQWITRLGQQPQSREESMQLMQRSNPAFIARNHRVEEALTAAVSENDYKKMNQLLHILKTPYEDQPEYQEYTQPPAPSEHVYQTFCGT